MYNSYIKSAKKCICLSICISLLFSLLIPVSNNSSAASTEKATEEKTVKSLGGAYIYSKEQEEEYYKGLSFKEKALLKEKEMLANAILKEHRKNIDTQKSKGLRSSCICIPDLFVWPSIYYDYCVPASTATILYNITNMLYSQPLIFSYTGYDTHQMPQYLSERQSQHMYSYISKYNYTCDGMCARLYSTIAYAGVPAAICINVGPGDYWHYSTSENLGHCVVVYGIYDDFSSIMIGDPGASYVPGCPTYYSFGKNTVYAVCSSIVF